MRPAATTASLVCGATFAAVAAVYLLALAAEGDLRFGNGALLVLIVATALAFPLPHWRESGVGRALGSVLWFALGTASIYMISFSFVLWPASLLGGFSLLLPTRDRNPPAAHPAPSAARRTG